MTVVRKINVVSGVFPVVHTKVEKGVLYQHYYRMQRGRDRGRYRYRYHRDVLQTAIGHRDQQYHAVVMMLWQCSNPTHYISCAVLCVDVTPCHHTPTRARGGGEAYEDLTIPATEYPETARDSPKTSPKGVSTHGRLVYFPKGAVGAASKRPSERPGHRWMRLLSPTRAGELRVISATNLGPPGLIMESHG